MTRDEATQEVSARPTKPSNDLASDILAKIAQMRVAREGCLDYAVGRLIDNHIRAIITSLRPYLKHLTCCIALEENKRCDCGLADALLKVDLE